MVDYSEVSSYVSSFFAAHPEVVGLSLAGATLVLHYYHRKHRAQRMAELARSSAQKPYHVPEKETAPNTGTYRLSGKESRQWDAENRESRAWFKEQMNRPPHSQTPEQAFADITTSSTKEQKKE